MKKEYIHIVNGEGGIYLDIVEKLFGKEEVRKTIREDFNKVKKELLLSNIDYADLRKVLIPFANAFSYFFSTKDLPNYMYFSKIYKQIILMLSKQEKAIFLCGDLIYDYSMNNEIKDLFEKYEINCKDFEESDFCNVIIVGITINSANKISEMLKEKFKAYRGYCNITNPSKMKEFCFSFAIQNSIKIGYKIIHSCPDEYDKSDYSVFCIKENTELSKYTLVPIIEELYGSFLTFRPFIDKIPKKELLYSLNAFYDLDDIKKPKIIVANEKLNYCIKHINSSFTIEEIQNNIAKMIDTNQISHMAFTNLDVEDSIDFNIPYYKDSKIYTIACKWNFGANEICLITITKQHY